MKVEQLPDGRVKIRGTRWSDTFTADKVPAWERFYRDLHARTGLADDLETAEGLAAIPNHLRTPTTTP